MLALLPMLMPLLTDILGRAFPDPAEREKQMQALLAQLMQADTGQMEVNKAEAASADPFTSRWRPFIGWVCGAALLYSYILVPIGMWVGFVIGHPMPKPPVLDDHLWELLTALLGLGGMRTFEKIRGAAK